MKKTIQGAAWALCAALMAAGCASGSALKGSSRQGSYSTPNGDISVPTAQARLGGTRYQMRDMHQPEEREGVFLETSMLGMNMMAYKNLEGIQGSFTEADVKKIFEDFAVSQNAAAAMREDIEVLARDEVMQGKKKSLALLLRVPESSGASDFMTKKKYDAHTVNLLFIRGKYLIHLMAQDNIQDTEQLSHQERLSGLLPELQKQQSGLSVRE